MEILEIRLSDDYGTQKSWYRRTRAWWSRHRRYYLELRYDFGMTRRDAILNSLLFK